MVCMAKCITQSEATSCVSFEPRELWKFGRKETKSELNLSDIFNQAHQPNKTTTEKRVSMLSMGFNYFMRKLMHF